MQRLIQDKIKRRSRNYLFRDLAENGVRSKSTEEDADLKLNCQISSTKKHERSRKKIWRQPKLVCHFCDSDASFVRS